MDVPAVVWQALVALLAAATLYLGILAKKAEKPREPGESLRNYIDQRAEHKVNNVVGALLPKLLTPVQNDVGRHSTLIDALESSDKDHGERLVGLETRADGMDQRQDARDRLSERERVESMALMARIEKKVDFLITGKMGD